MRLMTCHTYGNGSVRLEFGIRLSWNKDEGRHCIQLGSRSSKNGVRIPVKGVVHRGKGKRGATLNFGEVDRSKSRFNSNGSALTLFSILPSDKDHDRAAHTRGLPILVRIDTRSRVKESIGVGGWRSEVRPGMNEPELLAIARSMNGQSGRKHECFDGLLLMECGQRICIHPQGKFGMQFTLYYSERGLQLIQTADFDQEVIRRSGKVRQFLRNMKELERQAA